MKSDQEIFESYSEVLTQLKDIVNEDIMAVITNKTHILKHFPGYSMKMQNENDVAGEALDPQDPLIEVMRTGKRKVSIVPKEQGSFAFASISNAIRGANGEIIGGIAVAKSLLREEKIEEISKGLANTLKEVNDGLQEVASGSQGLSLKINNVAKSADDSAVKIKEVNKVISAITDISSHSNLLGLNAAIEAARAGEEGRGFAVVAGKMRKLAAQSNDSAKMVTQILTQMKESIELIIKEINFISSIAESQTAATEEITAALEEVSKKSQTMAEFSKITG